MFKMWKLLEMIWKMPGLWTPSKVKLNHGKHFGVPEEYVKLQEAEWSSIARFIYEYFDHSQRIV